MSAIGLLLIVLAVLSIPFRHRWHGGFGVPGVLVLVLILGWPHSGPWLLHALDTLGAALRSILSQ